VSQYLKNWKVEFDVAENGNKAVEKVIQGNYDLVLMDLQMPELNGYDASRKIRNLGTEKYKALPILALSASAKIDIKEKMEAAGINDFVGKPFKPDELFDKILAYGKDRQIPPLIHSIPHVTALENSLPPLTGESASINLEQFIKLTRNNKLALKKLIEITIEDFLNHKNAFTKALISRDREAIGQLTHKIRMMVTLLKAKELDALIKQGRAMLEKTDTDDENILTLSQKLENAIDTIIYELQQFNNGNAHFQE
jgi:CheY-like chemotaxis protein